MEGLGGEGMGRRCEWGRGGPRPGDVDVSDRAVLWERTKGRWLEIPGEEGGGVDWGVTSAKERRTLRCE